MKNFVFDAVFFSVIIFAVMLGALLIGYISGIDAVIDSIPSIQL